MTPDRGGVAVGAPTVGSTFFGIPGWGPEDKKEAAERAPAPWNQDGLDAAVDPLASWIDSSYVVEVPDEAAGKVQQFSFTADAPEFVPISSQMTTYDVGVKESREDRRSRKQRQREQRAGQHEAAVIAANPGVPITTLTISGIPVDHTVDSFRMLLDNWGLSGTYNFFFMPFDSRTRRHTGTAFINFVDPTFAQLCQWLCSQNQFEGTALPSKLQGLEANIAKWNQVPETALSQPMVLLTATPTQWAVDSVNTMLDSKLSPQIREQFNKTKMCTFHKKRRCALGQSCPFAHSKDELQPPPDLFKTKLCYNYFRQRCHDNNCKFAHGYHELRATSHVYKTSICRWFANGSCKAGKSCRYAHGLDELRGDVETAMQEIYSSGLEFPGVEYPAPGGYGGSVWADGPSMQMAADFEEERAAAANTTEEAGDAQQGEDVPDDLSEALGLLGDQPLRQTSAPAASVALRPAMEDADLDAELPMMPRHRSWSDGDLKKLCELEEALQGPWDL